MSRMTDDGRHEGAVVFQFADGMTGSAWSSGPIATTTTDGTPLEGDEWQHRTEAEIVAWRVLCTDCSTRSYRECWRGPVWTRVTTEAEQNRGARRVFSKGDDVSEEAEGWIMADWDQHIAAARLHDMDLSELKMELAEVASQFVNRHAPDLPPLDWTLGEDGLRGRVQEDRCPDPERVAQQWRTALGFDDGVETSYGTRQFEGRVDGQRAKIWYVTDRNKFLRG